VKHLYEVLEPDNGLGQRFIIILELCEVDMRRGWKWWMISSHYSRHSRVCNVEGKRRRKQ